MLVRQQTQASSIAPISDKLKNSAFREQDSSEICDPRKALSNLLTNTLASKLPKTVPKLASELYRIDGIAVTTDRTLGRDE